MRPYKYLEYSPKCLCPNLYNKSLPLHWKMLLVQAGSHGLF